MNIVEQPRFPELLTEEEKKEYHVRAIRGFGGALVGLSGITLLCVSAITENVKESFVSLGLVVVGFLWSIHEVNQMDQIDRASEHRPQAYQLPFDPPLQ